MYGFAKVTTPGSSSGTTFFINVDEIVYVRHSEEVDDDGGIILATNSDTEGTAIFLKNGTSLLVNETPDEVFGSVVFVSAPSALISSK
jgi:nitrogen fixation protein